MAEYCRSKGLSVEQVEAWRDACMQANGGIAQEAALAETAALFGLRKKAIVI